jgi:peptidoglycan hydrolase-like protein with peptidoglycan-binding domain
VSSPLHFQPLPPSVAEASADSSHSVSGRSPIAGAESAPGDSLGNTDSADPRIATKVVAGTMAAAAQAAEPRSNAPLRVLVTRQTKRDRIIGLQNVLAALGYLEPQNFDGTFGKRTTTAIKAFQKANGLPETGALTDDLMKKICETAGKSEPPDGHLFVRQAFERVFDAPVGLKDPERPLGTYVFTALNFAPDNTKAQWMAVTIEGADAASTLDRLEIPDDIRHKISERLTPGSTLIVADTSLNSASLSKGSDFVVLAKDSSKVARGITDQPLEAPDQGVQPPQGRRHYPPYYPHFFWFRGPPGFSPW